MMCTVCGLPGVKRPNIEGAACSVECAAMLHFRATSTPDERRFEAWEWRRRRADVRGLPFDEPSPMMTEDREMLALLAAYPNLRSLT